MSIQVQDTQRRPTDPVVCRLADGSEIETTLAACLNTPGATVVTRLPPNAENETAFATAETRPPTDSVVCRLADGSEIETTLAACLNTPGATVVSKLPFGPNTPMAVRPEYPDGGQVSTRTES